MPAMKAKYCEQFRVESEQVASDMKMVTDVPVDNCGKGEAFSPADGKVGLFSLGCIVVEPSA